MIELIEQLTRRIAELEARISRLESLEQPVIPSGWLIGVTGYAEVGVSTFVA